MDEPGVCGDQEPAGSRRKVPMGLGVRAAQSSGAGQSVTALDEPEWKVHYQYALANFFAMAEVVSKMRTDENTKYIDELIDSATETWMARADAGFFIIPDVT